MRHFVDSVAVCNYNSSSNVIPKHTRLRRIKPSSMDQFEADHTVELSRCTDRRL